MKNNNEQKDLEYRSNKDVNESEKSNTEVFGDGCLLSYIDVLCSGGSDTL